MNPPEQKPGSFTPEQWQKAVDWVNQHWTRNECPFHGPTKWQLEPTIGEVRAFTGGGLMVGGGAGVFPLLVLTCSVCGYAVFLNALVAGIVLRPAPPAPSDVPASGSAQGEEG